MLREAVLITLKIFVQAVVLDEPWINGLVCNACFFNFLLAHCTIAALLKLCYLINWWHGG
jgi:hypothetical protein